MGIMPTLGDENTVHHSIISGVSDLTMGLAMALTITPVSLPLDWILIGDLALCLSHFQRLLVPFLEVDFLVLPSLSSVVCSLNRPTRGTGSRSGIPYGSFSVGEEEYDSSCGSVVGLGGIPSALSSGPWA